MDDKTKAIQTAQAKLWRKYASAFLWGVLFIPVFCVIALSTTIAFVDFSHTSAKGAQWSSITFIALMSPVIVSIGVIPSVITFGPAQILQAMASTILIRRYGLHAHIAVLLVWPICAILTWCSYDYLTPSKLNLFAEMPDHQYVATFPRYVVALAAQFPLSLFSYLYVQSYSRPRLQETLFVSFLALSIIGGAAFGFTWKAP